MRKAHRNFPNFTMKEALFLLPVLALAAMPAPAEPRQADNYESAAQIVSDDGYIIFAYADGWDYYSKRVCEKLMASPEVQQAAGNAVFMRAAIPNNVPTEQQEQAEKARLGKLALPSARSYPAIFIFNKDGRACSTIYGSFMQKPNPQKVAKLISKRLSGMKEQQELLARAEKAQGIAKAALLGQAASIPHIEPQDAPNNIIKQIKALDPEDSTGYARSLRHPYSLIEEIVTMESDKTQGWKAALSKVESYLNDPHFTPVQKQTLHALAIGLLRRNGSIRDTAAIREHAKAMREIDPESVLGRSASLAEREFCRAFNLAEGWSSLVLKDTAPIELEPPHPVGPAGTYVITFTYERGRHACGIRAVSIYDGKTLIAEDRHKGTAGLKHTDNVYRVRVPAALSDPHVFVEFNQEGNKDADGTIDSYGSITIKRGK